MPVLPLGGGPTTQAIPALASIMSILTILLALYILPLFDQEVLVSMHSSTSVG